jgi:hypothetical protein
MCRVATRIAALVVVELGAVLCAALRPAFGWKGSLSLAIVMAPARPVAIAPAYSN